MPEVRRALGPGRVNLIGDHTDYNRGLALPMAIDLGVTVSFTPDGAEPSWGHLVGLPGDAVVPVTARRRHRPAGAGPGRIEPAWARLVAAMAALTPAPSGGTAGHRVHPAGGIGPVLERRPVRWPWPRCSGSGGPPDGDRPALPAGRARRRRPGRADGPAGVRRWRAGHALLIDFDTD